MSVPPRSWELDPHARRRRVRALLIQAALWAPSMNEKDTILEAMSELADWKDPPPARWPGSGSGHNNADFQLSPTQPGCAALKGGADRSSPTSTNEVATTAQFGQHCGKVCPELNSSSHHTTQPSSFRRILPQKNHF